MTTLLITASDLTKNTIMGGNIDPQKYVHVIKESQIFVVEPILGTKLYNKIVTDFESESLTGNYLTLLNDYIKPILIYSVAAEFILVHSYNIANGGVFKNAPENSESVSKSEVDFLVQEQQNKVDAYIQRMHKFLCGVDITEYNQTQDNNYDLYPDKTQKFTGGWKLDSNRNDNGFLKANER
ncbi:hypothetical protein [Maribacter sp. 2210JD10-5]|uniref:DUF6712 family protein n=1 Tax=Maribacter sp. 2210JD10-5 TaxID=3386272 RepID=UPI0039BC682C